MIFLELQGEIQEMKYYKITNPDSYQESFCEENSLLYTPKNHPMKAWIREDGSYIYTFGSMGTIQCGIGNYSVTSNFFVEYQYDTVYLHLGIISQGTTYSVVENKLVDTYVPSAFVAIEKASSGVNCWKLGAKYKGVELSIEYNYLKKVLLLFLGYDENALHFLSENIRYLHLPDDMLEALSKIERLLLSNSMTPALLLSISLELISYLIHPKNQTFFHYPEHIYKREISVGNRTLSLSKEDFQAIIQIHEILRKDATQFYTIYELSQNYHISEQKLKNGFREIYQISIWDYANEIRMNLAIRLLWESTLSIQDISRKIGYQSQAAFLNMFKKWSGITPSQFRRQLKNSSTNMLSIGPVTNSHDSGQLDI